MPKPTRKKSGPKAERLKIDKTWEDAVGDAMRRGKPPAEPKPQPPKKKSRPK